MNTSRDLILLAASRLSVGGRRLRALARGDEGPLREWIAGDSTRRLAHARAEAQRAMTELHRLGARVVAIGDSDYPVELLELHDPPAFLCVRGKFPRGGVAVVGSRTPTPEAEAFAFELARSLQQPIVSGLALGIDGAAHRGALAAKIPTVAYVGYGFRATYPPEHVELENQIVACGGAVAGERLPGDSVTRWSLVKRDRLQAAHARAVVMVTSELDGGAMHTIKFARELGRPCFAVTPPHVDAQGGRFWAGNVRALAEGAEPLPLDVNEAIRILDEHRNYDRSR